MIDFQPIKPEHKELYEPYLQLGEYGCEHSFVNQCLWGRQKAAFVEGCLVTFSQFDRRSVYMISGEDKKAALFAVMEDAKKRGIPCRIVGLSQDDCEILHSWCPECLRYHVDRDSFDYVYDITRLATLSGKKLQKKRNHLNRFREENPEHQFVPITDENTQVVADLVDKWYALREEADPHSDFLMEKAALGKALRYRKELGMVGLLLITKDGPVAMTLGSFLRKDTFDVHFEKALDVADGAYPAITNGFARYLQEKYPDLKYLNREDDMGLEGLRKAKMSYYPDFMVEKYWAHLAEDGYDY